MSDRNVVQNPADCVCQDPETARTAYENIASYFKIMLTIAMYSPLGDPWRRSSPAYFTHKARAHSTTIPQEQHGGKSANPGLQWFNLLCYSGSTYSVTVVQLTLLGAGTSAQR